MSATELEVETHDTDTDEENGQEVGEEEVLTGDEYVEVEAHVEEESPREVKMKKPRSKEVMTEAEVNSAKAEPLGSYMDQTDTFPHHGNEALPEEAFQSDDDQKKGAHKERGGVTLKFIVCKLVF